MYEVFLALNFVVAMVLTVYYLRHPAASVFHPASFYILTHVILFVIRPILSQYYGYSYIYRAYQFTPSLEDKITVLAAASLGLVSFVLASLHTGNEVLVVKRSRIKEIYGKALTKPFLAMAILVAPLGLASLLRSWSIKGTGKRKMVMDAATGFSVNTNDVGYFYDMQLVLAPLCAVFAWQTRFRWWSFIPLLTFAIFRGGLGNRSPFVVAIIATVLLYLYSRDSKWPKLGTVAIGVVTLAFFNMIGQDRGQGIYEAITGKQQQGTTYSVDNDRLRPMEGMDFGNLEYFEFLVYAVPGRTGTYEYFADQLQILTEPIPRILWKEKPVGSPVKLFSLFDYGRPYGMTRSLPGEGWTQLGWLGVFIWCGLWGLVYGHVYRRFARSQQTTFAVCAYAVWIGMMYIFVRDGTPISVLRWGIFYIGPIGIWMLVASQMGVPRIGLFELMIRARRLRRQRDEESAAGAAPAAGEAEAAVVPRSQRHRQGFVPRAERMRRRLSGLPGEA